MPKRLQQINGTAFVVTDLHGAWEPYVRLRDLFLSMRERGEADVFVLCGDLIHATSNDQPDASLDMLRDVMRLQAELGAEHFVMLLGNHELPHIYGIPLAKGDMVFTPAFEKALATLGDDRAKVIEFLAGLPFYAYTAGGVMLSHGGAAPELVEPEAFGHLLMADHLGLLAIVEEQLREFGYGKARANYERIMNASYNKEVNELFGITSPADPRYNDLLRGTLATSNNYEFDLIWSSVFTRNEQTVGLKSYENIVRNFLQTVSRVTDVDLQVLVCGHIVTRGGYALVGEQQLRLSSYAHARPNEAGLYLLLDADRPARIAADLVGGLRPVFPEAYK
jgi:hypothetical protein